MRGRPVAGAIFGLLFGVFLGFDLLQLGMFALDSVLTVAVPTAGLVLGLLFGLAAPLRFGR